MGLKFVVVHHTDPNSKADFTLHVNLAKSSKVHKYFYHKFLILKGTDSLAHNAVQVLWITLQHVKRQHEFLIGHLLYRSIIGKFILLENDFKQHKTWPDMGAVLHKERHFLLDLLLQLNDL